MKKEINLKNTSLKSTIQMGKLCYEYNYYNYDIYVVYVLCIVGRLRTADGSNGNPNGDNTMRGKTF